MNYPSTPWTCPLIDEVIDILKRAETLATDTNDDSTLGQDCGFHAIKKMEEIRKHNDELRTLAIENCEEATELERDRDHLQDTVESLEEEVATLTARVKELEEQIETYQQQHHV